MVSALLIDEIRDCTADRSDGDERNACLAIDPVGFQIRHPPAPHELNTYITPDSQLFQTIHMGAAVVDENSWQVVIDGLVQHPLRISFSQLLQFPSISITSFHECYGSPLVPLDKAKNLWRIGNVVWTGVRFSTLLELAHPLPAARYVWSDGLDYGSFAGIKADRYQKDLPLEKAQSSEVLLAYQMNGESLSKERGGPVRLVVPGWFGTNSTKWICRLSLQAERSQSPFTTRWYNAADPTDPDGEPLPVWAVNPNSMIVNPRPGELVSGPYVDISGFAWSCDGISNVQVSLDEGRNWENTIVAERKDFGWQAYEMKLHLSNGNYRVMARATALECLHQPLVGRRNSVHFVDFTVSGSGGRKTSNPSSHLPVESVMAST